MIATDLKFRTSIKGRPIGIGEPPYVIAEMSSNHNQSFSQAIAIVDAAKRAGAHALKLQTYTADTLTLDHPGPDFLIDDPNSLWNGRNLHELYSCAYTDWNWVAQIFEYAEEIGIDCFSSAFDDTSVDFLEDIGACAYKIASFENVHLPLIRKAASTGKPLIISTGLASEIEIDEAVENAREAGCRDLIRLKCTSDYPADPADSNLRTLPYLAERYGCVVGLSDHTLGIGVAIASIALGASVIEKHFTTSRDKDGVDSSFSTDEAEMALLVAETDRVARALGEIKFGPSENEETSLQFRRSIYAVCDIKKGDVLSPENIRIIRPGYGLHPRHYDSLIGNRADKDYVKGDRLGLSAIRKT